MSMLPFFFVVFFFCFFVVVVVVVFYYYYYKLNITHVACFVCLHSFLHTVLTCSSVITDNDQS